MSRLSHGLNMVFTLVQQGRITGQNTAGCLHEHLRYQAWACASLHGSMAEAQLSRTADILRDILHLHQLAAA